MSVTVNEEARTSYPNQIDNEITSATYKWASLDGSWKLDGSYHLIPAAESENYQVGWWGKQLSDSNNQFSSPYPKAEITFDSQPFTNLRVIGDNKREEYPVDFNIRVYSNDNLIHEEEVSNNNEVAFEVSGLEIEEADKIELEIYSWSHANRQVKILEAEGDLEVIINAKGIANVDIAEDKWKGLSCDTLKGQAFTGIISQKNLGARFGIMEGQALVEAADQKILGARFNKITGLSTVDTGYLRERLYSIGVNGNADINANYVRERIYNIRLNGSGDVDADYVRKRLYSIGFSGRADIGAKAINIAHAVASLKGIANTDIDYVRLRIYSIAFNGKANIDINEEKWKGARFENVAGLAELASKSLKLIIPEGAYVIDKDNYRTKDQPANSDEIANYIIVETAPLRPADQSEELYNREITVEAESKRTVTAKLDDSDVPSVELQANLINADNSTIINEEYFAWGGEITIENTGSEIDELELIIEGKTLDVKGKERVKSKDENSIINNGKIKFELEENHLIQDEDTAQKIADIILASSKDPRRDIELDWRGNPALILADLISVPEFQNFGDFYVTRQNLEYDGALTANTKGRKIDESDT